MPATIEGMDTEKEQKDNRTHFLENKIGLPDCKIVEELSKVGFEKISSEKKGDRIMDRLNNSLNNHKNLKNKKQSTKSFTHNDLIIETTSLYS